MPVASTNVRKNVKGMVEREGEREGDEPHGTEVALEHHRCEAPVAIAVGVNGCDRRQPPRHGPRHERQAGGDGEDLVEAPCLDHEIAEDGAEPDGKQPGDPEDRQPLRTPAHRDDVRREGEQGREERDLHRCVDCPHHEHRGAERLERDVGGARRGEKQAPAEQHTAAPPLVDDPSHRGPQRKRYHSAYRVDQTDPRFGGAQVLQVAGEMHHDGERDLLEEPNEPEGHESDREEGLDWSAFVRRRSPSRDEAGSQGDRAIPPQPHWSAAGVSSGVMHSGRLFATLFTKVDTG